MRFRRPLALSAATALGIGVLFGTTPAFAEESPPPLSTTEATAVAAEAVSAIAAATDSADIAVGYGVTTAGRSVVFVDEAFEDDASFRAVAPTLAVDDIIVITPPTATATTDVVGGAGYMSPAGPNQWRMCSVGFSAWDPAGQPAIVTAGHCANNGEVTDVQLSKPSLDTAHTGTTGVTPLFDSAAGRFGFFQFGGPGNTPGEDANPRSTDIAVIDVTNSSLTPRPEVTDWSSAASDDLAASTTPIKQVAEPVSGAISKSGRTTGITTGNTSVLMMYEDGQARPTEILDGYMKISETWVHGFAGGATTSPGDSGGAVFQGENAVGVVSGSPTGDAPSDQWAWYTRLADAIELTGGYTVALDIDAPALVTPGAGATLEPGDDIVVSVPSNATALRVTAQGADAQEYPAENGSVSFAAPTTNGSYSYSAVATNGHSASAPTTFEIRVQQSTARPTITEQRVDAAEGKTAADATVGGTGIPGAVVTVTGLPGASSAEATVSANGSWALPEQEFTIGAHTLTAIQSHQGEASAEATGALTIAPAAPRITSIDPDQKYAAGDAPGRISGTGLADAAISVLVNTTAVTGNDDTAPPTVGANGQWRAPLGDTSATGTYAVTVTQTVNGVDSAAGTVSFTVAAKNTTGGPGGSGGPGGDGDPTPTQPAATSPGSDGVLAQTGGEMLLPFVAGAALLALLAAGGVFLFARRMGAMSS